jgi:hypothetical protein
MGEERKVYKVLVGNPRKDHSEDRGIDGIGMYLGEIGWGRGCRMDKGWWLVVVNAVTNLQVLAPWS